MSSLERSDLVPAVRGALKKLGGEGTIVEVAREIWKERQADLAASGDLYYLWQYDMRWAGQKLRDQHEAVIGGPKGKTTWRLVK